MRLVSKKGAGETGGRGENEVIETGYHDRNGIPIYVGDLIRVKHYKHKRNRRQMWLYLRVGHNGQRPVVFNWNESVRKNWLCYLCDCGLSSAEVVGESGLHRNEAGEIITFNERPRLAVEKMCS